MTGSVRDRSVTLMLLAIVAIFLCCNSLAFCNNIYEIVRETSAHDEVNVTQTGSASNIDVSEPTYNNQDLFDLSIELSNILISLNSSSSIFVYLFFSSKYRIIIKHWLGIEKRNKITGVAITTAMVTQKTLELSCIPDAIESRRAKRERDAAEKLLPRRARLTRGFTSEMSPQSVNRSPRLRGTETEYADDQTTSRKLLIRFHSVQCL